MTLEALERELDTAREAIRDLRSDWRLLMGAFAIAFVTLAGALALGYLKLADKVENSETALRGEIRASAGDVKELVNSAKTDSASSSSEIKSDIKELRSLLMEQRATKK